MIGAHARRYNAHSIGVCYEGGLDANGNTAEYANLQPLKLEQ